MYQREMDALDRAQAQADADYENQLTMAQLAAQYGDYSGLAALGIDTSALTGDGYTVTGDSGSSGSSGRSGDSGGDSGETLSSKSIVALRGEYPDGVIPLSDWNKILSGNANITEADLIAAGFTSGETTGGKLSSGEALLKATGAYEDQESQVMALYMMYVNGQITEKQYKDLADAITTDRQNR